MIKFFLCHNLSIFRHPASGISNPATKWWLRQRFDPDLTPGRGGLFRDVLRFPITLLVLLWLTALLFAQTEEREVYRKYSTGRFIEILKPYQTGDYSVGIQGKGRLANVLTNFGQLASFHIFAPSLEWPAFGEGQDDEQQYGWGVDFMVGYNGDVIESFQDPASNLISREWQPAAEDLFSGEVTVSETDLTPIMATSDNEDTWPRGGSNAPFWPGLFRQDTGGNVFPGEFTSERDLYCVFTDAGNDTPYGLRVEQTAYSFTRRYAEDFLVYRFNIKNTAADTLKDLYPGMMVQFLIDFDNHDLINFSDSNNDGKRDLVYMWDQNGQPQEPWSKVGYIGLLVVNTPNHNGITNFHFFHDDFTPASDELYWMLLTSDTTGAPDTTRARYFHGEDIRIDDVALAPALDPEGNNRGGEITWAYSVGPVTLAPGDSAPLDIAIIAGDDEADLLANVEWVWTLAENSWNGSNPPASPQVRAYPADGKVTVVWDAERAEQSRDYITREKDFEGYKIYRSSDRGKTWGKIITDSRGNFLAFQPIAQFDLENGVTGNDPLSGKYLGSDTGVRHTFVDTTVQNGVEYWYTVTAYDRGDQANGVESLESALGLTTSEINVAAAIPATRPSNLTPGAVLEGSSLQPASGKTDAEVEVEILDPNQLKNSAYEITFRENTPVYEDTAIVDFITTFTLKNTTTGDTLLFEHPLTDESGDNLPVIDGFRLTVKDVEAGRTFAGWTKVAGDTCTFDWFYDTHNLANYFPAAVEGIADFKIVTSYDDSTLIRVVTVGDSVVDGIGGARLVDQVRVPIKVYDVTDPANPIDVSGRTILYDFEYWGNFPPGTFGPKGWDLTPGGKGYNGRDGGIGPLVYPDELFFLSFPADNPLLPDTAIVSMRTQNFDSTEYEFVNGQWAYIGEVVYGISPSPGDEYTILTGKPLNQNVVYRFTTTAGSYAAAKESDLENIRVVPNPYLAASAFDNRLMFTNLPGQCEIFIYTVAGDLVRRIDHQGSQGATYWDLKNESGLSVAYGLYVYVVKTRDGQKRVGKFSIIK